MAKRENSVSKKMPSKLFYIVIIAIIVVAAIWAVKIGSSAASAAYSQALEEQSRETYEMFYNSTFDMAEKKYHVSNDVRISIEGITEIAELEVLQVSDVEYVYREGDNTVWTAVRGHGVYTVDLALSEFVIDNERLYVFVRAPRPRLNTAGLDYEYENYLFEDGIFNGNTSEGVGLAMEDLKRAQSQLQAKLASTQTYYEMAEDSARELIETLVKNFNSALPELKVEIEFVD